jgi:GTP-binding protein HflX
VRALGDRARRSRPIVELRIPASDGRTLAEVHRLGEVLESREEDGAMILRARVPTDVWGRLARAGVISVTS